MRLPTRSSSRSCIWSLTGANAGPLVLEDGFGHPSRRRSRDDIVDRHAHIVEEDLTEGRRSADQFDAPGFTPETGGR